MTENPTPPSPDTAIHVRDIKKSFGFIDAVRGISFDLKKGEFLTLLGPNGAGKTTLLNMLSSLTRPTSGTAIVGGKDVLSGDPELRKEIGVISHSSCLVVLCKNLRSRISQRKSGRNNC
jgi:ABC-type multidrug transport system ATPase subunit